MFLRSLSCCTGFDHVTNQFHLSLNFYFVLLFFYLLTRTILTTIRYPIYTMYGIFLKGWFVCQKTPLVWFYERRTKAIIAWQTCISKVKVILNWSFRIWERSTFIIINWVIFRSLLCMKPLIYFVCISAFKILVIFQCWALETL